MKWNLNKTKILLLTIVILSCAFVLTITFPQIGVGLIISLGTLEICATSILLSKSLLNWCGWINE